MITNICHRVTVKELPLVTPADAIKVLESDFKDDGKDSKTVSQDYILFLNTLKEGIHNSDGHYEMPLPFEERPDLPDNKHMTIHHLSHFKRKRLRGESTRNII